MLAFCKKAQVGGMMCSRRIDDVPEHVFAEESRINSTFGGNLTDMVRAARILEVIFEEDLLGNAARVGEHLRAGLEAVQAELGKISNARGRGLMCAIDLPSAALRDQLRRLCFEEGLILLGCGERTVRFRPALNITVVEVDEALARLRRAVARL
jgi:L-lysine 6-transaminase